MLAPVMLAPVIKVRPPRPDQPCCAGIHASRTPP